MTKSGRNPTTYLVTLQENDEEIRTFFVILSEQELILSDVKTMIENSRTISYINSNEEETLSNLKNIYKIIEKTKNYIRGINIG